MTMPMSWSLCSCQKWFVSRPGRRICWRIWSIWINVVDFLMSKWQASVVVSFICKFETDNHFRVVSFWRILKSYEIIHSLIRALLLFRPMRQCFCSQSVECNNTITKGHRITSTENYHSSYQPLPFLVALWEAEVATRKGNGWYSEWQFSLK